MMYSGQRPERKFDSAYGDIGEKKRPKDGAFLFGRQASPFLASAWGALRWFMPFLPGWVRGRLRKERKELLAVRLEVHKTRIATVNTGEKLLLPRFSYAYFYSWSNRRKEQQMYEVITANNYLPSTIEDLSRFILVGREKLVAVRAEIRAIQKVGLAQEVREQKLHEAQEISEAVLDAEVRIGELMAQIPKATPNNNPYHEIDTAVELVKPKADVIRDAGFTQKQVERFQTLALHPDLVEKAKAEARENEEIVTRASVLDMVREQKTPHVANNSGNNEWYTPEQYIELAREVLGEIDLDPASCEYANETVKAKVYYSEEDDGLSKEWHGRVWMNPPYSADLVGKFTEKFVEEYETGFITEGIVLVNNATETSWFVNMAKSASAVVFPRGRIRYSSPTRESLAPLQGQAFLYFGYEYEKFLSVFSEIGWGARIYD